MRLILPAAAVALASFGLVACTVNTAPANPPAAAVVTPVTPAVVAPAGGAVIVR